LKLKIYQVDAFTNTLFGGNPAAVVPLTEWLTEDMMQAIALENNLSETVYFVKSDDPEADFDIRWFTPKVEINLCGHATLASAYILYEKLNFTKTEIVFSSKSGLLKVSKNNGHIWLDFPSWMPQPLKDTSSLLHKALGDVDIISIHQSRDLFVELKDEESVINCKPDFTLLNTIRDKVIITARGTNVDFVSRFFAPAAGVDEDPVTGSAHSQLIPFWTQRLNKTEMYAEQLSERGGKLWCKQNGDRVYIGGDCVFYMEGEIFI
jgi:PhzF family phenazine biosynthesis protein